MGVSGIVLAGGISKRFGRDKAIEPFEDQPLINRVIDSLTVVVDEVVVVVNSDVRGQSLPLPASAKAVTDLYPNCGSLGGIFTGLTTASNDWGLVVACDMPFLNTELLKHMIDSRSGFDAVVPIVDGWPEPVHALYSKACLPHIEKKIQAGRLKIAGFFEDVRVNYIPEDVLTDYDQNKLSFFNINTQDDLERANSLLSGSPLL